MKIKPIVTKILMLIGFISFVIYDIFVATDKTDGNTISEITLFYSLKFAFVPYGVGFLCGHLFWPWDRKRLPIWLSLSIGAALGVLITILAIMYQWNVKPVIWLVVGVPVGHFIWYQNKKEETNE
jgi:hypothetical protein